MKINVNTGIEETSGEIIALRDFANLLKLKIIYMNTARQITLQTVSVNRPGLILSGFDDYFARSRVQVLGNAEMYYLYQMTDENRRAALKKLFKTEVQGGSNRARICLTLRKSTTRRFCNRTR